MSNQASLQIPEAPDSEIPMQPLFNTLLPPPPIASHTNYPMFDQQDTPSLLSVPSYNPMHDPAATVANPSSPSQLIAGSILMEPVPGSPGYYKAVGTIAQSENGLVVGSPSVGSPIIGSPIVGSPIIGSPILGSPILGSPIIGSSVMESSVGSPTIGSSTTGSPTLGSLTTGSSTDFPTESYVVPSYIGTTSGRSAMESSATPSTTPSHRFHEKKMIELKGNVDGKTVISVM